MQNYDSKFMIYWCDCVFAIYFNDYIDYSLRSGPAQRSLALLIACSDSRCNGNNGKSRYNIKNYLNCCTSSSTCTAYICICEPNVSCCDRCALLCCLS